MEDIIEENANLVYSIVSYYGNSSNKEDLFQVGCIGLIKAYQKFDSSMGVKFSTYAFPYILGEIKKFVREDKSITIGRGISSLNSKIIKTRELLSQQLMRDPSNDELASYLNVDIKDVTLAINSGNAVDSLDYVMNDEGKGLTLYDLVGTNINIDLILDLKEQLNMLSKEERELIISRYMDDLTQQETARKLGINQVQVSRKEQKILSHLRSKLTV